MVSNVQTNDVELPSGKSISGDQVIVTIEDVNRVLEIGRLLFSVLTEEEIVELQKILNGSTEQVEIGNTGVT